MIMRVVIAGQASLRIQSFAIRAYKNADESTPQMIVTLPDGTSLDGAQISDDGESFYFAFASALELPAPGIVATASYRHTLPIQTSDDSYRVQFTVNGVSCTRSDTFPAFGTNTGKPISSLALTIISPSADDQVVASRDAAVFEAQTSTQGQVERVEFFILDQAHNILWQWYEYQSRYCVFGGNDRCGPPPDSWWNALPDGRYCLVVRAATRDNATADAERCFIKRPIPAIGRPTTLPESGEPALGDDMRRRD